MNTGTKTFIILASHISSSLKGSFSMNKWDLIRDAKMVQNMQISNVIHYVDRMTSSKRMITSIDAEKAFAKMQHLFMIKISKQIMYKRNALQHIKSLLQQARSLHHNQWWQA
jgi:hypothetical protein